MPPAKVETLKAKIAAACAEIVPLLVIPPPNDVVFFTAMPATPVPLEVNGSAIILPLLETCMPPTMTAALLTLDAGASRADCATVDERTPTGAVEDAETGLSDDGTDVDDAAEKSPDTGQFDARVASGDGTVVRYSAGDVPAPKTATVLK